MSEDTKYLLKAVQYDLVRKKVVGSVRADADAENFDPDKYQLYCPDCWEHGHFCRVKREPPDIHGNRARFTSVDREISTHQRCDNHSRYQDLDSRAFRYGGRLLAPHSYRIPFQRPHPGVDYKDDFIRIVHRASRVAKLSYATMFDPELLAMQEAFIDGVTVPLREAITDHSDLGDIYDRLAQTGTDMTFAGIVYMNGTPKVQNQYQGRHILPGQPGKHVHYRGQDFITAVHLRCASGDVYKEIREQADAYSKAEHEKAGNKGPRPAAAFVVFARARLDRDRMEGALSQIKSGQRKVEKVAPISCDIHDVNQVYLWTHARTFQAAVDGQLIGPPMYKKSSKRHVPQGQKAQLELI